MTKKKKNKKPSPLTIEESINKLDGCASLLAMAADAYNISNYKNGDLALAMLSDELEGISDELRAYMDAALGAENAKIVQSTIIIEHHA